MRACLVTVADLVDGEGLGLLQRLPVVLERLLLKEEADAVGAVQEILIGVEDLYP